MNEKIRNDLKESMKAKNSVKTNVLRGILAAFTNELVSKGKKPDDTLTNDEMIVVIKRIVKQRKDSIEQFQKGNRPDLVESETAELKILEEFVPAAMPRDQVERIAKEVKEKMGITDKSKMGILMGGIMKELKGGADGAVVKEVVEELLK